ncbi:MAG: DUF3098 domain-containing protein [Chitinophagaceae bacterium]|nr:DUF3098 domain-containing protein [Chitinophagaceae bacterium]
MSKNIKQQTPLEDHTKVETPITVENKTSKKGSTNRIVLFSNENYMIMFIGIAVILIGFLLMIGGKSTDPNVFDKNEIYSFRRITLAPIVVILGLVIEVYAIMKKTVKA